MTLKIKETSLYKYKLGKVTFNNPKLKKLLKNALGTSNITLSGTDYIDGSSGDNSSSLKSLKNLDDKFYSLSLGIKFLNNISKTLISDRIDYFEYHLSYIYLLISSIFDITLKLININYNLGFENKNLYYNNKYKKAISGRIKTKIEDLDLYIKDIRNEQNFIKHSRKIYIKNSDYEIKSIITKIEKETNIERKEDFNIFSDIVIEIKKNEKFIKGFEEKILNILDQIYKDVISRNIDCHS